MHTFTYDGLGRLNCTQLQAFFLVSDDMMDQSVTRRGQPCYYRLDSVNYIAINDSFMLEMAIYHLIKTHFRSEPYYVNLLELFHEVRTLQLITAGKRLIKLADHLQNGNGPAHRPHHGARGSRRPKQILAREVCPPRTVVPHSG